MFTLHLLMHVLQGKPETWSTNNLLYFENYLKLEQVERSKVATIQEPQNVPKTNWNQKPVQEHIGHPCHVTAAWVRKQSTNILHYEHVHSVCHLLSKNT